MLKALKQQQTEFTSIMLLKFLYSLFVLFKCTNNFISVFPNYLDHSIYETKSLPHVRFHFSIFCMSYHFSFSFSAQNLPLVCDCGHIITLPVPVNCRNRNLEGNFTHKVNYHYHCHFPGLAFVYLAESIEGLPSEGGRDFRILKMVIFLENYVGTDDWQCRCIRGRCSYTLYWSRKRNVPYGN